MCTSTGAPVRRAISATLPTWSECTWLIRIRVTSCGATPMCSSAWLTRFAELFTPVSTSVTWPSGERTA